MGKNRGNTERRMRKDKCDRTREQVEESELVVLSLPTSLSLLAAGYTLNTILAVSCEGSYMLRRVLLPFIAKGSGRQL